MMDAEQIVELILDAARESRVLTGGIYKDEPIIRTGRQAFGGSARNGAREPRPEARQLTLDEIVSRSVKAEAVPKRIMQMCALDTRRNRWISSYEDPKVFYEQACFMQDYTDNLPYGGNFERYYPTYADMTDAQLRGYFTWRTRWRAGVTKRESTATRRPNGVNRSKKVWKCCSARMVVGQSTMTCLASWQHLNAARSATSVLPKPTSPQSRRSMGRSASMSTLISAMADSWSGVRS